MADAPTLTAPKPPMEASSTQFVVALAIVISLSAIAIGLIVAGMVTGKWDVLATAIGAVVGILGTALNAPTGIASVIKSTKNIPEDNTLAADAIAKLPSAAP